MDWLDVKLLVRNTVAVINKNKPDFDSQAVLNMVPYVLN